ncbi:MULTISPECIES: DNA cytosine methyltransferase [Streptococcus]|jgi:modification methylase bsuRI|uniref:DNA (cytosine-5-)-methyltransferase n=1 Tax=Streptococcus salivarius TaxID=1304 RepID=A0A6A8UID6_STRSL|nr:MULTISPECIES: DNA cytosine methyltransferase [Streptococcus]MCY7055300.1 DNA cytosine methyltransferase [Streptococcus salivarius]MTQ90565.1 DNA (cytosine-5-)-methyltransferase [Streptococcus salivarius]MTR28309.1 DNA (cytosine-5-)-methyltransferase [Streptococcus salivarius]MTR39564.1 DNA (cytosine-5-)-methyltransferase [Streptococcus salivarius]
MEEKQEQVKRSRGRFKPEMRKLSNEDVKKILLQKISEEELSVPESEDDNTLLSSIDSMEDKFNVVSLFSGAGGLDLGLELAGLSSVVGEEKAMSYFKAGKDIFNKYRSQSIFHTIYTNDMFKEANMSYKLNFPETVIQHEKDIRKVSHFPKCQIMIGGFPCPGFSEAGPRLVDDPRNFLYIHFIRALIQTQPEFFVAENVKGMMTLGHGEVLNQIVADFAAAGYTVTPHLVNARDYGVPQSRERVFLIGVHKEKIENKYGFYYQLPAPTHGEPSEINLLEEKQPFVTLEQAIGDLRNNPGPIFQGEYSTIYMSRNRKKSWSEQSFTIQASGRQAPQHPDGEPMTKVGKNKWVFNGNNNRRLSVKEIARIQTFPDWFEFSDGGNLNIKENGRIDKIYKQIGNAVPVLLAKAITQPISDFIYKEILKGKKYES